MTIFIAFIVSFFITLVIFLIVSYMIMRMIIKGIVWYGGIGKELNDKRFEEFWEEVFNQKDW